MVMSGPDRFARMLCWYPPAWRNRYGQEMVALLEDTHGMGRVTWSERMSLAKAGSIERLRSAGVVGDSLGPDERLRAGSLLVLCAWAVFVVAGAVFAKFTDNWEPQGHHTLASASYTVVRDAGMAGGVIVLLAGVVVLPALVRLIRQEGRAFLRGVVLGAVWLVVATVALTAGLVVWAHQLSAHNRNGGLWPYEVAFVVWSLSIVAATGGGTAAVVSALRRVPLSIRALRSLGALAVALSATMAVIIAGTLTWWVAVASAGPGFLGNGLMATSNVLPAPLLLAGVLMLVGLGAAATGTLRVGQGMAASNL